MNYYTLEAIAQTNRGGNRAFVPMGIISATPRSVIDATRFTAATLHAMSKPVTSPSSAGAGKSQARKLAPAGPVPPRETPEERVRRLRAAHLAAKNAQESRFDLAGAAARQFFDSAHRITVIGLIGFTRMSSRVLFLAGFPFS